MRLKRAFADLPLQRKLLRLVSIAAVFALLVAAVAVIAYDFGTHRPRANEEAREQVRSIAAILAAAVEFQDASTAEAYLGAFGRQRGVRALAIVMADGQRFAGYLEPGTRQVDFSDPKLTERARAQNEIVVMQPIESEMVQATLWMSARLPPLLERLPGYATLLGVTALSLFALAIMLSITVRRAISEPVQALADAARDVTRRQDYSSRVPAPRNDEIGQLAGAFNTMLATIEQREQALQSSEETARRQLLEIEAIYSTAQVGLCVVDLELRYVRVNQRLAEITGREAQQMIGATISEVVPDLAATLNPICQRVIETGHPVLNQEVSRPASQRHEAAYWLVNHHPLRDEADVIRGINVAVVEITERKRAEQDRIKLESQLRQAQKMEALGTLAGGIAHDFNNVLTAVAGNAQLALEDLPPDHPAMISLREIQRGTERARDLVRRILAFSRPEQNVQHLIDLRPVVDEVLRLLRATASKMIDIRLEVESDLPVVRADATQVHQVLMNLCTNACDAMKRGGTLTVRLRGVRTDSRLYALSQDLPPGNYLRVSVEDTGTGIQPDVIERVFEPFFTTKPPGEGTGLGLSMVHGIMRGHRGAILMRSTPGEGTVFDLYFPASEEFAAPADPLAPTSAKPAGEGEHILYVDDEEALVYLVLRTMERMGYRVTGMTQPQEAIDAIRAEPGRFDLVISDLGMPGMSGMELAAELLAIRADLPIIITSGYVRAEDAQEAERIGVRDIVLKPNTVAEMGELIRERLNELRTKAQ